MGHLSVDVRASLRLFAFYLANGTVDVELLDGFDYRSTDPSHRVEPPYEAWETELHL
ncbi:hypothetical protein [Streptomyces sp. NPDC047000]|uniref:DUF7677 family protein n=1 Tax=Streptomyces sp. NPDC047000 TaxID=3155474 RepID=UPI0033EA768B